MAVVAMASAIANGLMIEVPPKVIDHHKIEEAVIVDVHPGCCD